MHIRAFQGLCGHLGVNKLGERGYYDDTYAGIIHVCPCGMPYMGIHSRVTRNVRVFKEYFIISSKSSASSHNHVVPYFGPP